MEYIRVFQTKLSEDLVMKKFNFICLALAGFTLAIAILFLNAQAQRGDPEWRLYVTSNSDNLETCYLN